MSPSLGVALKLAPRPNSTSDEKSLLYEARLMSSIANPEIDASEAKKMASP